MVFCFALIEILISTLFERKINNMFLFHVHTYVEFYFLMGIYNNILVRPSTRKLLKVLAILFCPISLLFLLKDPISVFNSGQRYFETIFLMMIMFLSIYELNSVGKKVAVNKNALLLLSVGYLIYFSGTLLLFLLKQKLVTTNIDGYWIIHGVFNILLNLTLTFVLWNGKEKINPNWVK